MVGRGVRGHPNPSPTGVCQEADRLRRRRMRDVQPPSGQASQRQVPGHHHGLGLPRDSGQPEERRIVALVHLPSLRQSGVLGVLADHDLERLGILKRQPHDARGLHAVVIVGEQADPGFGHLGDVGECLAGQALGDGSGR